MASYYSNEGYSIQFVRRPDVYEERVRKMAAETFEKHVYRKKCDGVAAARGTALNFYMKRERSHSDQKEGGLSNLGKRKCLLQRSVHYIKFSFLLSISSRR